VPQRPDELASLVALIRQEGVKSYLEVGLRRAGTFEAVGEVMPFGSLLVGVDWPIQSGGRWKTEEQDDVYAAVERLKVRHEVAIVQGNSRDPSTVAEVEKFKHFDCVFIDGDHSDLGVRSDWKNYGRLGRIVAIHDIDAANANLNPRKMAIHGVRKLWDELCVSYRTIEIIGAKRGFGTGVLWRA
jgi:hypothetical protein